MSPLLGPILAQLVTLGVADRTEARYVVSGSGTGQQVPGTEQAVKSPRVEAATYPRLALNVGWKHSQLNTTALSLGYAPSLTVTPLDSSDPDVYLYHQAVFLAAHERRYQRTTVRLTEAAQYAQYNFLQQALSFPGINTGAPSTPGALPGADPGTSVPGGTPGTGGIQPQPGTSTPGGTQLRAADRTVRIITSVTTLSFAQLFSAVLTGGLDFSYIVTGSVYESDRDVYPLTRGPRALLYANYRASRRDTLTTSLSSQYAGQASGNNALVNVANETWSHRFDLKTTSTLGGGLSASRNSQPNGLVSWSIYPTFNAGINHIERAGRGSVSIGATAFAAPALDPIRASVDPRLTLGTYAAYGLKRFTVSLAANSAVSLGASQNRGTLNTFFGTLTAAYALGAGFSADTGARAAFQSFESTTTIPPSVAFFIGVTFAAVVPMNH